jgi:hypothetical protein
VYSSVVTRRVISFIVLLCFGFFSLETVVADVHDGDSTATPVAQATAAQASGESDAGSGEPGQSTTPHEMHVCHCIHAHGGLQAMAVTLATPEKLRDRAANLDVAAPAKVDRDVHVRPPIA